jgi:hypothetical protein
MTRDCLSNPQAACELHSVLADILEEYEYDTECHEQTGMDMHSQRDMILRAKRAIAHFTGEPVAPCYWEAEDYEAPQEDE